MTETLAESQKIKRQTVILLVTIAVVASSAFVGAYYLGLLNANHTPTTVHFTISMTNLGFNDSRDHSAPWPIMNVVRGQSVTISVENNDTVEPHGFVISHYFDAGIKLGPGESHNVVFVASQAGSFLVYCNILCSIHQYMLNGQLNVNP
jgi:heme/copper-type cytochrome/quinol oxidase subunit 2